MTNIVKGNIVEGKRSRLPSRGQIEAIQNNDEQKRTEKQKKRKLDTEVDIENSIMEIDESLPPSSQFLSQLISLTPEDLMVFQDSQLIDFEPSQERKEMIKCSTDDCKNDSETSICIKCDSCKKDKCIECNEIPHEHEEKENILDNLHKLIKCSGIFKRYNWICKQCEDEHETLDNYKLKCETLFNVSKLWENKYKEQENKCKEQEKKCKSLERKNSQLIEKHIFELEEADKREDKLKAEIIKLREQIYMQIEESKIDQNKNQKIEEKKENRKQNENKKDNKEEHTEKEKT